MSGLSLLKFGDREGHVMQEDTTCTLLLAIARFFFFLTIIQIR